jgi:hypothetical protein
MEKFRLTLYGGFSLSSMALAMLKESAGGICGKPGAEGATMSD